MQGPNPDGPESILSLYLDPGYAICCIQMSLTKQQDPMSIFLYALKAPESRRWYPRRFKMFLDLLSYFLFDYCTNCIASSTRVALVSKSRLFIIHFLSIDRGWIFVCLLFLNSLISLTLSFAMNLKLGDTRQIQTTVCEQNTFSNQMQTLEILYNTKTYKELLKRYFNYGKY